MTRSDKHDGHHRLEELGHRMDELGERLSDAAVRAEFETGEREETEAEAKAHVMVRLARMTLGFAVVVLGVVLLPLPGPGWVIIAGGFAILARDIAWAERVLRYIRRKVPGVPEDGRIPPRSIAMMSLVTTAALAVSLWWNFGRS